jgi:hypothetical protein
MWIGCLLLVVVAAIQPCSGQTFSASLSGVVNDPTGAPVPSVAVELRNTGTNDVRQASSGADGSYQFSNLAPGAYEISVQAPGFKKFVQRNLTLLASRDAELNISLELGTVEQSIEVTEAAVLLDTRSADHSATLNTTVVSNLPTNSRTPLNFVFALTRRSRRKST